MKFFTCSLLPILLLATVVLAGDNTDTNKVKESKIECKCPVATPEQHLCGQTRSGLKTYDSLCHMECEKAKLINKGQCKTETMEPKKKGTPNTNSEDKMDKQDKVDDKQKNKEEKKNKDMDVKEKKDKDVDVKEKKDKDTINVNVKVEPKKTPAQAIHPALRRLRREAAAAAAENNGETEEEAPKKKKAPIGEQQQSDKTAEKKTDTPKDQAKP